ncbi:MAG: phenylalanine--tRNA ligase subunit beta [Clostridiaceae bacterium]|nr:phenylalanine--tRNA ligase subunit beta [Clostridiaceae bacterium]
MKVTMEWLKEFTPIDQDIKSFCDNMTLSGSKVENHTTLGAAISQVVTGLILKIERHPDADKLVLCQIDIGGKVLQIVTGAPNVHEGAIVPVAVDGATLANDVVIHTGMLRGQLSEGMLCSVQELGFTPADFPDAADNGIYLLPAGTPVGQDISQILHLDDPVIDFEITSNRVDCFAVEGLAREAAITFDRPFQPICPKVRADQPEKSAELATVSIAAPDLCYRYCGRVVRNVRIGPSPDWLRRRLRGVGMRPINNIVDITNYVMLELGQPMHAFDLDQLAGRTIRVRRAFDGEIMRTLDSVERRLDSSMLVISDASRAVALAGVMGAENSEITAGTKTILFESATFNPLAVRQAAKKVGLRTEASSRYEKGLDCHNAERALDRACELIELLEAGSVCQGFIDEWPVRPEIQKVRFSTAGINGLLGTTLTDEWIIACFERLGMTISQTGSGYQAIIPSYRPDLACEADLAEEAARFYGYNRIKPSLLSGKQTTLGGRTPAQKTLEQIKTVLLSAGFYEACTYSFESPRQMDRLLLPPDHPLRRQIIIQNPLGEDYSAMRTSMLPSMLEVASTNWNRSVDEAAVFEIAYVYQPKSLPLIELPDEIRHLTAFMYNHDEQAEDAPLFFTMKGIVEELFLNLGLSRVAVSPAKTGSCPWLHPGRCAAVELDGRLIGQIGEIHPDVAAQFSVPPRMVLLDLIIDPVVEKASDKRQFVALPRYPAVTRDLALLVDRSVPAAALNQAILEGGGELLEQIRLFDVYQGPQVANGKKSMAYSLVFRAANRTLNDEAITPVMQRILDTLHDKTGAQLRE